MSGAAFANWAGTASCQPRAILQPTDEAELSSLVRRAAQEGRTIKAVGAGHSWTDIACTDGYQLNLDHLDRILSFDRKSLRVTVQAGIRLHRLIAELRRHRLTLPVVGSILEQSVAGAISTATHGSAPELGNLSCQVVGLRIVLADGRVRDIEGPRDPELLAACRVGLGALGIISQVTLRVVPAFALREVSTPLDFDEVVETLPQLVQSAPYIKLWWIPHTARVQVVRCWPYVGKVRPRSRFLGWLDQEVLNRRLFAGLLRLSARSPDRIPTLMRAVERAYFRASERIGANTDILPVAMPPRHDETEYAIAAEKASAALVALRELILRESLRVNFIAELRFVAADDAWLSPMHGRPSCCVGAYIAEGPDRQRYFDGFERLMMSAEFHGRPHWAKYFSAPSAYLREVYPRYERFAALRADWDPQRRFDNLFLQRVFA